MKIQTVRQGSANIQRIARRRHEVRVSSVRASDCQERPLVQDDKHLQLCRVRDQASPRYADKLALFEKHKQPEEICSLAKSSRTSSPPFS